MDCIKHGWQDMECYVPICPKCDRDKDKQILELVEAISDARYNMSSNKNTRADKILHEALEKVQPSDSKDV